VIKPGDEKRVMKIAGSSLRRSEMFIAQDNLEFRASEKRDVSSDDVRWKKCMSTSAPSAALQNVVQGYPSHSSRVKGSQIL